MRFLLIIALFSGLATCSPPVPKEERVDYTITVIMTGIELLELDYIPYLMVGEAPGGVDNIDNTTLGMAVRYEDGRNVMYLSEKVFRNRNTIRGTVFHELAHFKTWDVHGMNVDSHGIEFQRICRSIASMYDCLP